MIALPSHDVVHLWHLNLECDASNLQRLEKLLSHDEQARAARYRFARDRDLFVAARGLLRELLARYTNVPATQLRFAYGAWGKPSLEEHPGLCFNLSHSGDRALVAVAHQREVGVDIERMRTDIDMAALAGLVFCDAEKRLLYQRNGAARQGTFFQFWASKEAYIKADGRGVSLPLPQIDVSAVSGQVSVLDEQTGQWRICPHHRLKTVNAGPEFVAAVAAAGHDWELEHINRNKVDCSYFAGHNYSKS